MNQTPKPIDEIFYQAVQIEAVAERDRFLDEACGQDRNLRQQIETLVEDHFDADGFLERPAEEALADLLHSDNDSMAQSADASPATSSPGRTLGDFRIIREIGRGGMGVVYQAEQISLERPVALKVLPFAAVLDQRQLQRFKTEAKAAAGLHHGNIVPVIQVGSEQAVHFYAMQFIEGQNVADLIGQLRQLADVDGGNLPETQLADFELASSIASGQFAPPEPTRRLAPLAVADDSQSQEPLEAPKSKSAVETRPLAELSTKGSTSKPEYFRTVAHLGIQAAEALQFAHENGILHRDIKPSNLMLDAKGKLWITDFGLARVEGDAGLTMTGDVMGTLRYMSPEQALGQRDVVDGRSDVYSLGVTLYEMLTLTPIYPATDRNELLQKRSHEEPAPLRQVNKEVPVDLETIVLKAIAKEPEDRYATAQELADDLRRYLNHEPILARRRRLSTHIAKWAQRNRTLAGLLFSAAFIGGIVAASVVVVVKDREGNVVAKVTAPDGEKVKITIEGENDQQRVSAAIQDPITNQLWGLIPYPTYLPSIGRWQIVSRGPHSFPHHNWKFTWSPDSRFLAFGDGGDVRVYSVPDFRLIRLFSGHTGSVVAVDWSLDGKTIASTSIDNTVRLWDAETGVPGPILAGHRDRVNAVAWHPSGQTLATGSRDNTVRLWRADGSLLCVLKGHTELVSDVAWSPNGKRLVSIGDDGTLRFWNAGGKPQKVISLSGPYQRTVAWSPDGETVLISCFYPKVAQIWNVDGTGPVVLKGHSGMVVFADWSPDGKQIATASWDNNVQLWKSDGTADLILKGHDSDVHCVKWSPDGKWLASGSEDQSILLWGSDGKQGPRLNGLRPVSDIAWSPDGKEFGFSVEDHTVRTCDAEGAVKKIFTGHTGPVFGIAWSPNGDQLVSTSRDRSVRLWDLDEETVREIFTVLEKGMSRSVAWNPNGQLIAHYYEASRRRTIQFLQPNGTAGPVIDADHKKIYGIAWNAVGDRLASVGIDHWLRLWTIDGKSAGEFNTGQFLTSVAWKPNGSQLATGFDDGSIQLWTSDGKSLQVLKGHDNRVTDVKWNSDGTRIASGGRDCTIRLWSEDGLPQAVLRGHTGTSNSLDWRPHSSQLLSGGHDATVRLWDTESHRPLWVFVILPDKQSIQFSPKGRMLAGDPAVFEREFRYIVKLHSGAIEILAPSEFQRRCLNN